MALRPAKPDAAKGAQLYDQGDASRGVIACASCHGAAGSSTIPANLNLAAQPHEYPGQTADGIQGQGRREAAAAHGAGRQSQCP